MPNLFITNVCNLDCNYCFAKGMLGEKGVNEFSLDEIKTAASFVRSSGKGENKKNNIISILGGEPTLHSKFRDIIDYLTGNGFIVKLFTNGTFPAAISDYLKSLKPGLLYIILNMNRRENYSDVKWNNLERNLRTLNSMITLGMTIYEKKFDYRTILQYIETYDLRKEIRLGISLPIVNGINEFVRFDDVREIGGRIVEFSGEAFKKGIIVGFDCGYVMCMFTRKELGILQSNNANLNFLCDGAIDIGKNGRVWRCFPLYSIYNTNIGKFDSVRSLKEYYNSALPAKVKGISGNCSDCDYFKRRICSGGCYGFEFIQQ